MMKRSVSLAVCFAAMIWGAVAHAEIIVLGQGTASCGQFIATIGNVLRACQEVGAPPTATSSSAKTRYT